jgi:hypothetical protein
MTMLRRSGGVEFEREKSEPCASVPHNGKSRIATTIAGVIDRKLL